MQHIIQHLFQADSLEEVSRERLEELVEEYPSFSMARYLLSRKLQTEDASHFNEETQKTNLYFTNPLWLQWLLRNTAEEKETPRVRPLTAEVTPVREVDPAAEVAFAPEVPETMDAPGGGEVHEAEAPEVDEAAETTELAESREVTPVAEVAFAPEVPETMEAPEGIEVHETEAPEVDEAVTLPAIAAHESGTAVDEPVGTPEEGSPSAKERDEEPDKEHGEEYNHAKEREETLSEEPAPSAADLLLQSIAEAQHLRQSLQQLSEDHAAVVADNGSSATPLPVIGEIAGEPIRQEEEPIAASLPVSIVTQAINLTEPEQPMEQPVVFESYHTIDYFASQGIKLKLDENPTDKLGKQVKSFTEWLKVMRRLPQKDRETVPDIVAEHAIQTIAAHSIEGKEVLTETMAEVLTKQGMPEKASEVYRKLSLLNPDKSAYFAAKIEQLKNN